MLAQPHPDDIAIVAGGTALSFRALRHEVERCKQRLPERLRDIRAGAGASVCILHAHKRPWFVIGLLALYELGWPVAVFAPAWTPAEVARRRQLLGRWIELGAGDAGGGDALEVMDAGTDAPAVHHPDTALVLFTSGSTGMPRGVQLSRANIEANIAAVIHALDFAGAPGQVLFLPLSYSFGLLGQLLPALRAGVRTDVLDNLVVLKALADRGALAGMLSGVPAHLETLLRLLAGKPCPGVTHVISAGAPLHLGLRRRLLAAFPGARVYNNYGQTELAPRALCLRSDHAGFLSEAAGYPVGNLAVRLTAAGELCVRGDQVMLGYLGDAEATRARIPDIGDDDGGDGGGWLHTGDLATMDDSGLVSILGRNDELFQIGGERLGPAEIEAALAELPGVAGAAVASQANALHGAILVALLEVVDASSLPPAAELRRRLRAALSPHKIPSRFYIVAALPRTASGKLQRERLLDHARAGTAHA